MSGLSVRFDGEEDERLASCEGRALERSDERFTFGPISNPDQPSTYHALNKVCSPPEQAIKRSLIFRSDTIHRPSRAQQHRIHRQRRHILVNPRRDRIRDFLTLEHGPETVDKSEREEQPWSVASPSGLKRPKPEGKGCALPVLVNQSPGKGDQL